MQDNIQQRRMAHSYQMKNDCKNKWKLLILAVALLLTSCGRETPHEVSRSIEYSDIVAISDSETSIIPGSTTSDFIYGKIPADSDFNLSFREDMLIIDYGKTEVNLYRAKYPEFMESWYDENWSVPGIGVVCDWCRGWALAAGEDEQGHINQYRILSKDEALNNLLSVQFVPLTEIDDYEEIVRGISIDPKTEVLCWSYNMGDFPWDIYRDNDSFSVSSGLQTINYIILHGQYVDGLPIQSGLCGAEGAVYEWEEVMAPSQQVSLHESLQCNPSMTCVFQIGDTSQYNLSGAFCEEMNIISAHDCLPGIKKALSYAPDVVFRPSPDLSKENLRQIYGTDIEVYCMELSYALFDSDPFDDNLDTHEITMIPVWKVYYIVTNSIYANEDIVSYGELFINAVTGDSLYSDNYKPYGNEHLFPGANDI